MDRRFIALTRGVAPALLVLCCLAAPAAPPRAEDLVYRLETADGLPGAVRVDLTPDRAGTWTVTAQWTGRGLAGLRLEDPAGRLLDRRTGASPLELSFAVHAAGVGVPLAIRFAPLTDRGTLSGTISVSPPAAPDSAAERAPSVGSAPPPDGPGACLAPLFGEDPSGRAAQALSSALASAPAPAVDWVRVKSAEAVKASGEAERGRASRGALDRLWDEIAANPCPDAKTGAAFRQVLAALEDLTRRDGAGSASARARRSKLVGTLACLSPAGQRRPGA